MCDDIDKLKDEYDGLDKQMQSEVVDVILPML